MSQVRRIRRHLLNGGTITQRNALMDFGIMALPRRIADLKEQGFPVETTIEQNDATGQRFAMYRMKTRATRPEDLRVGNVYRMANVSFHPFNDDLVEAAEGHLVVTQVTKDGFICTIAGLGQTCFGWTRSYNFDLEYVGGLS